MKVIDIDSETMTLTPDAEGLYEHMRRCNDCIDAVMDWSKPMFYAAGKPGGRVRRNIDACISEARLNHGVVDAQVRMFVCLLQATGKLPNYLDHVATLEHERRFGKSNA